MSSTLKLSELESFLKQNQPVPTQQLLEFYQTFQPDILISWMQQLFKMSYFIFAHYF